MYNLYFVCLARFHGNKLGVCTITFSYQLHISSNKIVSWGYAGKLKAAICFTFTRTTPLANLLTRRANANMNFARWYLSIFINNSSPNDSRAGHRGGTD